MSLQQPDSVNRLAEVTETMAAMKGDDYALRASICAGYLMCLSDCMALMDVDYQAGRTHLARTST